MEQSCKLIHKPGGVFILSLDRKLCFAQNLPRSYESDGSINLLQQLKYPFHVSLSIYDFHLGPR